MDKFLSVLNICIHLKNKSAGGKNCISFATISLCLCGAVDWLLDFCDGERGSILRSKLKIYNWVAPLWLVCIHLKKIWRVWFEHLFDQSIVTQKLPISSASRASGTSIVRGVEFLSITQKKGISISQILSLSLHSFHLSVIKTWNGIPIKIMGMEIWK